MFVDTMNFRQPGLGCLKILSCWSVGREEYRRYTMKSVMFIWLELFLRAGFY